MQVAVAEWAGSGLYKAAGLPKAKGVTVKMAVARLVAESGSNSADDAQSLAIAVAVAEAKRTGAF
jgi:Holliday junction resolvasome RuvABC endonuclease subunit